MAVVATLPFAVLPIGSGSTQSGIIAPEATIYLGILNQVAWPNLGGQVAFIECDYSPDGGVSWLFLSGFDIFDVPTSARNGVPANTLRFAVGIPEVGNPNRMLRARWTLTRALGMSGTLEAI